MEEDLYKKLKDKGYNCDYKCKCKFHQIKKLGIKEVNIPDLKSERRIGVIKRLATIDEKIEDKKNKPIERVETETTVLKKYTYWYESTGVRDELIVILEQSKERLDSIEKVEENLDFVKFVSKKEEELNEYSKKVILVGIRSLFESGKISYWDNLVYILWNTNSTGKSAGVSLLISFYSAYHKIGIPSNFSATGKINTEDGTIKEIGGLKEKFISILRGGKLDSLILPQENYEEVLEISNDYFKRFTNSKKIKFYPVSHWKDLISLIFQWDN